MVKIHCDRCGREIKEDYYYAINIGKAELNPKYDYTLIAYGAVAFDNTPEKSPFEKLSSQKMYCEMCKNDIEYVINHWVEEL